jgi:DNA-binding MarR family transcriptional regulator
MLRHRHAAITSQYVNNYETVIRLTSIRILLKRQLGGEKCFVEFASERINNVASPPNPVSDAQVGLLRDTVVALVRRDGADLSARQLGVFLSCYLNEGAHTVRGLAANLNVSKPAITRALDRLGELDLARRKVDPLDRRSVLVQRTPRGSAFLRDLRNIMLTASGDKKKPVRKAAA